MTGSRPRNFEDILSKLTGARQSGDSWIAPCPAPGHKTPAGHLTLKDAGDKALVTCHPGPHTYQDICRALDFDSLTYSRNGNWAETKKQKTLVATFSYEHEKAKEAYQIRRFSLDNGRKTFEAWHKKGDEYVSGMGEYKDRPIMYHLPEIPEWIAIGKTIYLPEGELKADLIISNGGAATTSPFGAGRNKWRPPFSETLRGAHAVILPDNDKPGCDFAQEKAASLYGKAASLKVLELPGLPEKGDIVDWFKAGNTFEQLEQLARQCPDYEPPSDTTLPIIAVGNRQLRDITADGLKALEAANKPKPSIFRLGSGLARIGHDDRHRPFTEQASETIIRYHLSKAATFTRYDAEGNPHDCLPPLDLSRNILVAGADWHFPSLLGIVEAPTLRPDFTIVSVPGYDAQTGLYLEPSSGLAIPPIPDRPTDTELQDAVDLVLEPFLNFPFVDQASRANMTAAILLSCIRDAITGPVPLTLVTKPQPGCGGSLSIDSVAIIATGRPAHMIPATKDPEEWRKLLTTLLLSGDRYVIFDNVDHTLESEYLAAFLTALVWKDRILGQSQPIQLPNRTVCFANGNNARVGGNLARRIVPVLLYSPEARPWLRDTGEFKHPKLREWLAENRGRIIAAILTIVRGWGVAGRPKAADKVVLGSFEIYAELVGNLLSFMGVKGFLSNLEELYSKIDIDTPVWANFFEVWLKELGPEPITVADLVSQIKDNTALKAALPDFVVDMEGKGYTRRLGNQLAKREGQKFDNGLTLARGGEFRKAVMWKVECFESSKKQTHTNLASNVCFESLNASLRGCELEQVKNKECKGPEVNSQNSQMSVKSESLVPDALGMTVDQALELWRRHGAPTIHLSQGVDCRDLGKLLSHSDVLESHLRAVKIWLDKQNPGGNGQ